MLGIAFTVGSGRDGAKTCFRYPLPPSEGPSSAQPNPADPYSQDALPLPEQFFRLGGEVFAKLFTPTPILCNQVFEMELDDILYISYPVLVPHKVNSSPDSSANRQPGASDVVDKASSGRDKEITLFNVVFAIDYDHAQEIAQKEQTIVPGSRSKTRLDFR